jgi:hypothetical protein
MPKCLHILILKMKGTQFNTQVMMPLSSPKKMAPFSNNMHYKTNFTIGIPGVPFNPQLSSQLSNNINEYELRRADTKIPSPYKIVAQSSSIPPVYRKYASTENVSPPSPKPKEALMVEKVIGYADNLSSLPPPYPIQVNQIHEAKPIISNDARKSSLELKESNTEREISPLKAIIRKGSVDQSLKSESLLNYNRKDPVGMFLPSQYEDDIKIRKDKNTAFLRDLTQLKMRKLQEKQV